AAHRRCGPQPRLLDHRKGPRVRARRDASRDAGERPRGRLRDRHGRRGERVGEQHRPLREQQGDRRRSRRRRERPCDGRRLLARQRPRRTAPAVDPVATGARVIVGEVVDLTIPGGAFDRATKTGWKAKDGSFKYHGGTLTVSLAASTKTPGLVKFKVAGKGGS